jgi:hypothetical protein
MFDIEIWQARHGAVGSRGLMSHYLEEYETGFHQGYMFQDRESSPFFDFDDTGSMIQVF